MNPTHLLAFVAGVVVSSAASLWYYSRQRSRSRAGQVQLSDSKQLDFESASGALVITSKHSEPDGTSLMVLSAGELAALRVCLNYRVGKKRKY